MKKIIALALVLAMTFALAACNGDVNNTDPIDIGMQTPTPPPAGSEGPLALRREYAQGMGMVAAGAIHSLGLRTDGTVLSAGHDLYGQRKVAQWTDIVHIAAGKTFSLGVRRDGTLSLAGKFANGLDLEKTDGLRVLTNAFMADAGDDFIAVLLDDGTVLAAGDNAGGQCDVGDWRDIVAIACGDAFTVGLKEDGTLVATPGAPAEVSSWTKIKKIAAGGASAVAGITFEGKLAATIDSAGLEGYADLVDVGADDCGLACVRADGTVVTKFTADMGYDPDYDYGETDLAGVTDALCLAVGEKHVVVMRRDGTAAAYGVNDDLQCDVGRFNLRPYLEQLPDASYVVRGLQPGTTAGDAKALIAAAAGAADVQLEKAGAAIADTDAIATGMQVKCDGAVYGTVVILGDVDENGAIDEADKDFISGILTHSRNAAGYVLRAAQLQTSLLGVPSCEAESLQLINDHLAGTARIGQFGRRTTGIYDAAIAQARSKNEDTVGWLAIPKTNVDYQIMFDAKTGNWYYNDHTPEHVKTEAGSIYAYYYGKPAPKNVAFTGHNARPSGTMFHQLHHIQEYNLGQAHCAQKKYCGKELTNLPDFKIYSNRVWTVELFGEEARWELFSMYETTGNGDKDYKLLLDNIWWRWGKDARLKDTDELVQEWINKQLELSEITIDTEVTAADRFMTVSTCSNEHKDSNNWGRLYFFFKQVD